MADSADRTPRRRLRACYILNSGFFFRLLYKIVKVMLDPITRSKVFIVTGSHQQEILGEVMHPDDLPVQYGVFWR